MTNSPLLFLFSLSTIFIVTVNLNSLKNIARIEDLRAIKDTYVLPLPESRSRASPAKRDTHSQIDAPIRREKRGTDEKVTARATFEANDKEDNHRIAGLNCDKYGGPSEEFAAEMVYWEDIPTDATFVSPFASYGKSPKYLTFEPDEGGWNNIRMSMETATVLALAMGRILVLPPEQHIYLLRRDPKQENNRFTFKDFFHFDSIVDEHPAVEVISMEEFYNREAITGGLTNKVTGEVDLPPFEFSSWDGHHGRGRSQWSWLRNVSAAPVWSFDDCVIAFPAEPGPNSLQTLENVRATIRTEKWLWKGGLRSNMTAVDGPMEDRLHDMIGRRQHLCIYDVKYQNEKVMHFMGDNNSGARLLAHFYAFVFFENHHQDLWTKRFVRDHLRYIDEIQCAAARIVHAVRQKAIENGDPNGIYDSFHIRRGDFQYKETRIPAEEIYENTKDILVPNSTIFVATDERDSSFFDPLRKHYNLLFLDDFRHLFEGLNQNYIGMLDQRIASRGRTFCGAYLSTFTGTYAMRRMRRTLMLSC